MAFEAADILRRVALRAGVSNDVVRLAHAGLLDAAIEYVGHEVVATRAWELLGLVTLYHPACACPGRGLGLLAPHARSALVRSSPALGRDPVADGGRG
jgi:hypothetical protein